MYDILYKITSCLNRVKSVLWVYFECMLLQMLCDLSSCCMHCKCWFNQCDWITSIHPYLNWRASYCLMSFSKTATNNQLPHIYISSGGPNQSNVYSVLSPFRKPLTKEWVPLSFKLLPGVIATLLWREAERVVRAKLSLFTSGGVALQKYTTVVEKNICHFLILSRVDFVTRLLWHILDSVSRHDTYSSVTTLI